MKSAVYNPYTRPIASKRPPPPPPPSTSKNNNNNNKYPHRKEPKRKRPPSNNTSPPQTQLYDDDDDDNNNDNNNNQPITLFQNPKTPPTKRTRRTLETSSLIHHPRGLISIPHEFPTYLHPYSHRLSSSSSSSSKKKSRQAAASYSRALLKSYRNFCCDLPLTNNKITAGSVMEFRDIVDKIEMLSGKKDVRDFVQSMRDDVMKKYLNGIWGVDRTDRLLRELECGLGSVVGNVLDGIVEKGSDEGKELGTEKTIDDDEEEHQWEDDTENNDGGDKETTNSRDDDDDGKVTSKKKDDGVVKDADDGDEECTWKDE